GDLGRHHHRRPHRLDPLDRIGQAGQDSLEAHGRCRRHACIGQEAGLLFRSVGV
ncbi:hypothetical protein LTR94_037493, partial [Friedmanniomyces endolithicus]